MTASTGADALFDKFGTYILPGRVSDPRRGIDEAKEAERIGLGAVWISERYASKEPAVLSGAVQAATDKVRITGTMYATMRNPIVTASVGNIMQALSGGRFRLMFARAVPAYMKMLGSPAITFERLGDTISIVRKLWAGETVNYEGILGTFPALKLTDRYEGPPPPIIFTAIGPKSLEFAGAHCDGVLLHPFVTAEGVRASTKIVREAAEQAGRDPMGVRIYHNIIVAPGSAEGGGGSGRRRPRRDLFRAAGVRRDDRRHQRLGPRRAGHIARASADRSAEGQAGRPGVYPAGTGRGQPASCRRRGLMTVPPWAARPSARSSC